MFPLIIRNWNVTPTPQQSQIQLRNPMTNTQAVGPQQNTTITSAHVKTLHFSGKFIGHWFLSPTSWPQPFSIPGAILGSSSLSEVCSKTSSLPLSPGELNQDKLDKTLSQALSFRNQSYGRLFCKCLVCAFQNNRAFHYYFPCLTADILAQLRSIPFTPTSKFSTIRFVFWVHSSVGRAPASHVGGRRFKSVWIHNWKSPSNYIKQRRLGSRYIGNKRWDFLNKTLALRIFEVLNPRVFFVQSVRSW